MGNLHGLGKRHRVFLSQLLSSRSLRPTAVGHFHLDILLGAQAENVQIKFITCIPQNSHCSYLSFLSEGQYHSLSQLGFELVSSASFPPSFLTFNLFSVLWVHFSTSPPHLSPFPHCHGSNFLPGLPLSSLSHCQSSTSPHIPPCLRTLLISF